MTTNPFETPATTSAPDSPSASLVSTPEQPATAESGEGKRAYTRSTPAERAQRKVDTFDKQIARKKAVLTKREAAIAEVDSLKAEIASLERQRAHAASDPLLQDGAEDEAEGGDVDGQVPGQMTMGDDAPADQS